MVPYIGKVTRKTPGEFDVANDHLACAAGGFSHNTIFQVLVFGSTVEKNEGGKLSLLAVYPNPEDLLFMTGLYEARKIVPVIDRSFPVNEVADALRYLGAGYAKGKIVITV